MASSKKLVVSLKPKLSSSGSNSCAVAVDGVGEGAEDDIRPAARLPGNDELRRAAGKVRRLGDRYEARRRRGDERYHGRNESCESRFHGFLLMS